MGPDAESLEISGDGQLSITAEESAGFMGGRNIEGPTWFI